MTADRGHARPRIALGSPRENPTTLTRQDFRGEGVAKDPTSLGGWDLDVLGPGTYDVDLRFDPGPAGAVVVEVAGVPLRREVAKGATGFALADVAVPAGPTRLRAWVERGKSASGVHQLDLRRHD